MLINGKEASYDVVASEYYDPAAHPTCYNFNRLSRVYLERWIPEPWTDRSILEVGAGNSCVAAILHARGYQLNDLDITDASAPMLAHSERWKTCGAVLAISEARSINRADGTLGLLVASLGDPYNVPEFWLEVCRVIRPGGAVLFTIPSFEWAVRFRAAGVSTQKLHEAEFELRDGRVVSLPSFILPLEEQVKMMEKAGLMLVNFESLGADALPTDRRSPKIDVFASDASSLVWGFRAIRQRRPVAQAIRELWKEVHTLP